MPELISPTAQLHQSWLEARDEWGEGAHMAGSGVSLFPDYDLTTVEGFRAWTEQLRRQADPGTAVLVRLVPSSYWWIVEAGQYLGAIDLRHELNEFLAVAGGHIGYGIRPSARERGLATWALGQVLPHARRLGLDAVLVTCDETNVASAKTIERNGGVLESITDTSVGRKRRYWIPL
jgi:predicted acetyltransferase